MFLSFIRLLIGNTIVTSGLKKHGLVLFLLFSVPLLATAQTTLSLKQAIALTLTHNPELKALPFKTQALEGEKQELSLRPPLHIGLEFENFAGNGKNQGIDALESTVTLGSVLELNNKRQLRLSAIDAKIAVAQMQQKTNTLDTLGALTIHFIEALKTQESILIAKEEQALATKSVSIVNKKAQQGAAADIDIQRAKVTLARINIQLDALVSQQQQQYRSLSQFWGESNPSYNQLAGELYVQPSNSFYKALLQQVKASPHAQQLTLANRIKDMQYQLSVAEGHSNIDWSVGLKHINDSGDAALVAGISTTLNQSQRNQGRIAAASAEKNAFNAAQKNAMQTLETQLFIAHSQRTHHAKAMRSISTIIIPALSEALTLSQQDYESGRYTYFDWSMAQQALFEAKHRLLEHATTTLISQALIEQLTGEPFAP